MLRAEFTLPSITAEEAVPERKAPIRVKFEIPYFTVSGIQVCRYEHGYFLSWKNTYGLTSLMLIFFPKETEKKDQKQNNIITKNRMYGWWFGTLHKPRIQNWVYAANEKEKQIQ